MTFVVAGEWVAVRIAQMDRVAQGARLWQVPLARQGYLGLMDNGQELIPVLQLPGGSHERAGGTGEHLVVILHVRGETVGVAIERAGRLCERVDLLSPTQGAPSGLGAAARRARADGSDVWLLDTDHLWQEPPLSKTA
ncbi:MAG TPA: chemotaxis protein CheW [Myxococcota bacterium]|nr:chemotaxis protein CheW [Myxococcota bacterium]